MPTIPMEPLHNGQKPAPKRGWFPMRINGHEMIVMTKEDGVKAVEGLNAGIVQREEAVERARADKQEGGRRARGGLGRKAYDAKVRWRRERAMKAEARAKHEREKAERSYGKGGGYRREGEPTLGGQERLDGRVGMFVREGGGGRE